MKENRNSSLLQNGSQIDPISATLDSERARLRREAGLVQIQHFKKPVERTFTAGERDRVTILFGGLTWKHEKLIQAVFQGSGYKCEMSRRPTSPLSKLGKEYGNNGQCNPTYFTVGNLVQYLQRLEEQGIPSRKSSTAMCSSPPAPADPAVSACTRPSIGLPCRTPASTASACCCSSSRRHQAASGEPGLKFTVDFGIGMLNALNFGDVMNDLIYQIRPYEVNNGETDRVSPGGDDDSRRLRKRQPCEISKRPSGWLKGLSLHARRSLSVKNTLEHTRQVPRTTSRARSSWTRWNDAATASIPIDVDRLRVKPIVKITGEFWAQTTEGDGNFNMFNFLEREGAQVLVEPIGTWVMYMMHQVMQK